MRYDLIVIGAGPGGYSSALTAAGQGLKTAVIERDEAGGVCLNRGCIPTKSILKSALIYREIKKSYLYGIDVESSRLNFEKIIERKNKVVSALRSGINSALKTSGIDLIKGNAVVIGEKKVQVGNDILEAENIIIAAGASPARPRIDGIDDSSVMYSDEALLLDHIPASMVVIGGGVIGLEFAAAFNEFGSKVTVIEMRDNILPGFDKEIAGEIKKAMTRTGIEIFTSSQVKSIKNGKVVFEREGKTEEKHGEYVLVSVGRTADAGAVVSSELKLETRNGFIITDAGMRTNIKGIYAVGDINGKEMLAHTASAEGVVAAQNILGVETKMKYDAIPKCLYTFPEAAMAGLTEEEAVNSGYDIKCSRQPVRGNGRALADGNIEGMCKIVAESKSGKILGIHIAAPYASEMIAGAANAVNLGMKDIELSKLVFPHPTVSEIIGEAAAKSAEE